MTELRQVLEKIWNDPVVRCPRHIIWWRNDCTGTRIEEYEEPLFYSKGARVDGLKRKPVWGK
jgi:hypothetical protein